MLDHLPAEPAQHSPFKVLAVIPARGGSKGVRRKNLRTLGGLPLIAHTIRAALASRRLDAVVVSTEDEEIAQVARSAGATVVVRPDELATDWVQNTDVVKHVLATLEPQYSHVVLLQPTSPLRGHDAIDACIDLLGQGGCRSVLTVTAVEHHPAKTMLIDEKGMAQPYTNWVELEARRQELPVLYRQNGAVYALAVVDFLRESRFIQSPCKAHVMHANESIDIDSEFDLLMAEKLIEWRSNAAP
jgi:CMP-N-acetylneuraminic acid synthetase